MYHTMITMYWHVWDDPHCQTLDWSSLSSATLLFLLIHSLLHKDIVVILKAVGNLEPWIFQLRVADGIGCYDHYDSNEKAIASNLMGLKYSKYHWYTATLLTYNVYIIACIFISQDHKHHPNTQNIWSFHWSKMYQCQTIVHWSMLFLSSWKI